MCVIQKPDCESSWAAKISRNSRKRSARNARPRRASRRIAAGTSSGSGEPTRERCTEVEARELLHPLEGLVAVGVAALELAAEAVDQDRHLVAVAAQPL